MSQDVYKRQVQTAPAVRAALGEEFGLPAGTSVTGKMAAALVIVEDGNDLQARPKDMPVVDKSEVVLARKHLGSLLKVSMRGTTPRYSARWGKTAA